MPHKKYCVKINVFGLKEFDGGGLPSAAASLVGRLSEESR
jgi:hypothetical protein